MSALSIINMNHSPGYQRDLEGGDSMDGRDLGKRALALIHAGLATHETFRIKEGMTLADLAALISELEAKAPRFWLGKRSQGDMIYYESPVPLKRWHGYNFISAIGPFLSRLGVAYYARCEYDQVPTLTPAEIERMAREDNSPVWAMIRESIKIELSLSADEIDAALQAQAEEVESASLTLPTAINVSSILRQPVNLVDLTDSLV